MGNLMAGNKQWAQRPNDERFWTVAEMREAVRQRNLRCAEKEVQVTALSVIPEGDEEVALVGPEGIPARFNSHSFGQFCARIGAPADYLTRLPRSKVLDLAAWGLAQVKAAEPDKKATLLIHQNGGLTIRAITSTRYGRAWDDQLLEGLEALQSRGWRVPPARPNDYDPRARPATEADVLHDGAFGLSVKVGDMIAPAGLYAGTNDMFAFMVNEDRAIDNGTPQGACRGFFMENSEVGARKFRLTTFLYEHVCGNHIVWGASEVKGIEIVHVGKAPERIAGAIGQAVQGYLESGAQDDEGRIRSLMARELGKDKEAVVEVIHGRRTPLSKKTLEQGYDEAEKVGVNPRSVWGMIQGITRVSQREPNADVRNGMDRAAGRLADIRF